MQTWQQIAATIAKTSGEPFAPDAPQGVGGGCINSAFTLSDGDRSWFVKTNNARLLDMFEAEAAGLNALADTDTLLVPRALCTGTAGDSSYIVMQYLDIRRGSPDWRAAGRLLAAMHQPPAERFGWSRANTIGSTPQHNDWRDDWIEFWREQRLGFQLAEAARNGYNGTLQRLGEQLLDRFAVLIDHAPRPSLLHGDLWGGNLAFTASSEPAIYDPAVYYGDREADLAMSELFGGFSADFYAAYSEALPLDAGYPIRRTLYNLYHILNHANLFGGGYAGQAERMMQSLLAEC